MASGGSSSPTYTPYLVNNAQLAAWMQTAGGQQYAADYNPNASYAQGSGGNYLALPNDSGPFGNKTPFNVTQGGTDVTGMIAAFNAWTAGNAQTQNNWSAYAAEAAANQGGEGDNTVTSGAAVGQRQTLLGNLANPTATAPTPGLGSLGMSPTTGGMK